MRDLNMLRRGNNRNIYGFFGVSYLKENKEKNSMKYQPHDIQTIDQIQEIWGFDYYQNLFGKYEYEYIAQRIVERSREVGTWIPVRRPLLYRVENPYYSDFEGVILENMVVMGLLTESKDGFNLTDMAIRPIARKFSAHKLRKPLWMMWKDKLEERISAYVDAQCLKHRDDDW